MSMESKSNAYFKVVIIVLLLLSFCYMSLNDSILAIERNYWKECLEAGQQSQDKFFSYVKGLTIKEILKLGEQAGLDAQDKELRGEDKEIVRDATIFTLGMIIGCFLENANRQEKVKIFTLISDKDQPLVWRLALVTILESIIARGDDTFFLRTGCSFIEPLHKIMLNPQEDIDLRVQSCRTATNMLLWDYERFQQDEVSADKISMDKIEENVSILLYIVKNPKENKLIKESAGFFVRQWYIANIPQSDYIQREILQLWEEMEDYSLEDRVFLATNAYLPDEEFIPYIETLLNDVKDKATKHKINKVLKEIKQIIESKKNN